MPLLETIEQRAASGAQVVVDTRIERARDARHGLKLLLEHERFDRIVVAAQTSESDGFAAAGRGLAARERAWRGPDPAPGRRFGVSWVGGVSGFCAIHAQNVARPLGSPGV